MKLECLMIGKCKMIRWVILLHIVPQLEAGFMFGKSPRKPITLNAWFQLSNMEADL